ncbi:MAG: Spy/CpxP family protein refolding chaperone [Candidatus Omnitrophica bacterium]|nr:Spy/CpxP family protein refolding chaperone [Candidatus Omnitrophota bacterium]
MKKKIVFFAVIFFVVNMCAVRTDIFAFDGHKKAKQGAGLEEDFFKKAHMLVTKGECAGLSEEQLKQIKELKISVKKDIIRNKAEIEIVDLDIESELWAEEIDQKQVNKLIDKKYELKKETAKLLIDAYVKLKKIITPEQKEALKNLYKCKMKDSFPVGCSSMQAVQ